MTYLIDWQPWQQALQVVVIAPVVGTILWLKATMWWEDRHRD